MTDPVRVLYIAGLAHSGSTLLSRVLGEVEGLFAAGEVYALSERISNGDSCGCGTALGECPFWETVLRSAFPEGDALPRLRTERRWIQGRTLASLAFGRDRERLQAYRGDLARLYRAIAEVSGSRVIVDSSKSPTFAYILDSMPGIDLCGVHVVRDPRATSYSWSVDPHFHRTRGPAFGARWTLWNLELEALAARRRGRFVRLRLEDFIRNPVVETRRILGTGVISIRASTTWRRRLSKRRELSSSLLASPLQLLYGYPVARRTNGAAERPPA